MFCGLRRFAVLVSRWGVCFAAMAWLVTPTMSAAQAESSCMSPQEAARSLVDFLQPDRWEPTQAWRCLDIPPGMSKAEAEVTAVRLKKVLDARGLPVPVDELSLEPNFKNSVGGQSVRPVVGWPSTWPPLEIGRAEDGRWLYSRGVVQATPRLYRETFSGIPGWIQQRTPGWAEGPYLGLHTWQLVYMVLLALGALMAGLMAQRLVADRFVGIARRAKIELKPDVVRATRGPLTIFAIGLVALWGIPDLQLGVQSSRVLLFIATGATSVSVVLVASRVVDIVSEFFGRRAEATESRLDDQVIPLASRAVKTAIWIFGLVVIIQNLGVDVTGLVAGVGVGSLAFALAAQDTVENLFGSVTIFTDRPFQIGDWVVIDGAAEGVVEEVGFRSTRIRTFSGSVVSVPNAKVANSTIDNVGERRFRRVKITVGLTYGTSVDAMNAFVEGIRAHLKENPAVADTTCEVHFTQFGASALEVMLYFFLDVPDWTQELDAKAQINCEIMRIAERESVEFAFPSLSVYMPSQSDTTSV
jgi:MscS family membrane protein